jgi:hypothetical protein
MMADLDGTFQGWFSAALALGFHSVNTLTPQAAP